MTRPALIQATKQWAEVAVIAAFALWCADKAWDWQLKREAQREADWQAAQVGNWLKGLKGE